MSDLCKNPQCTEHAELLKIKSYVGYCSADCKYEVETVVKQIRANDIINEATEGSYKARRGRDLKSYRGAAWPKKKEE